VSGPFLVPVFVDRGHANKGSLAVLSLAAERAADLDVAAEALVVGSEAPADLLRSLGRYGADRVISVPGDPRLPSSWVDAITTSVGATRHRYVLVSGGPVGHAVAAGVAARCHGGLITDVMALRVGGGDLLAEKSVFKGRQIAVAHCERGPGIIVMRPGAATITTVAGACEAAVEVAEPGPPREGVEVLASADADDPGRKLAAADVIVTGGRGLGGPESFAAIEELASAFGSAVGESAVGATRAVVDAGWRSEDAQVGLTGRTVSPKLYVAVGVSGAPQHRAGMETSQHILAINTDPRAPIFRFADLGIIGDFAELLPALADALRRRDAAT
jgi:electron transfer flavoprotein alpha subunit